MVIVFHKLPLQKVIFSFPSEYFVKRKLKWCLVKHNQYRPLLPPPRDWNSIESLVSSRELRVTPITYLAVSWGGAMQKILAEIYSKD